MCGRFGLIATWEEMAAMYGLIGGPPEAMRIMPPRYNIAPTQPVLAIRESSGGGFEGSGGEATFFRWGLVPSWAKDLDIRVRTINARAETVAEKPAFRAAFRRRRCLIPVSGFYEWRAVAGQPSKQPYWIAMADGQPFSFAGLWEVWQSPDGEQLQSCTIVTTEANASLRPVHHRMPVIVAQDDHAVWLTHPPAAREYDTAAAGALMRPYPDGFLVATPVGRLVNNVRNDGPDLIRRAAPGAALPPRPAKPADAEPADTPQGSLF
jgi:putative SOS response-associated peptidase YedK